MSYPKKLLRLRPTKGVALDLPANEVGPDFYTGASNVIFREGFAQRIGGSRAVYGTLPETVMHLQNIRSPVGSDTTNFWLVFGEDAVHALETSNSDDVTPSGTLQTVDEPWQYASTMLNGVAAFTNGLDKPQYWAGDVGTAFQDVPNFPSGSSCKSLVAFKYHLFALDIDETAGHFEGKVMWSDAAEPGAVPATWTAAADNEAGDTILGDTLGPIMLGVPLCGTLLIFKRSSTYACDYVGGNDVFSFRPLFSSRGALTRHAACDVGSQVFIVSDGEVALTDGTNWTNVAKGRVQAYLFSTLDQDNYENLFVVFNRGKNEVWICYPVNGGDGTCTRAIVYNVTADAYGIRTLPSVTCAAVGISNDTATDESWSAATYTWTDAGVKKWGTVNFSLAVESLVLGYGTTAELQDTQDSVAVAASISRYDLTFGEPERVKFVRRAHIRAEAGFGTLYVRVGARMSPTDSITWSVEQTLTEPAQYVNAFAQGRYISVEIRGEDEEEWTVSGIDIEAELRGYH